MTLKQLKISALRFSKGLGVFTVLKNSEWRRRRLLILCYHGVSLDDEHRWNPSLYMNPADLRARFAALREGDFHVLPLDEAVSRLYARDLPPRSVAITFDDGYHDFYKQAWPLLREFGYPATVYLTTLRCDRNLPIFNLVVSYMLWKRRGAVFETPSLGIGPLDLRTPHSRLKAWRKVMTLISGLNPDGKRPLARALAADIGADYDGIETRRLLTIMTPAEVSALAAQGLDVQLHTHRHRTPGDRDLFDDEIVRNRKRITEMTGQTPRHFCYPSGIYDRRFLPWLSDLRVTSATTCDSGFATPDTEALLLPRLVDHEGLAPIEFEGWLTGAAALTARKRDLKDVIA
jgi:peptidoglycan/xylan/chitin deacetylase (PgdA/CDA1 family)